MPNNYIAINQAVLLGSNLEGAICTLSQVKARLEQIKANMDNMTDGVTFTTLESSYGIPSGKGQTVYNLVAGAVADVSASSNVVNLLNWLAAIR